MHNRNPEKSQIPGEGVKTRKWRLAWEHPGLDEVLVDNVLPKKGRLSKAERDREQGETFAAMRRQHPAVESAINNLEHRGLDRVRSKGREGFARTVALSVVALNVHRLGRVLRQQALERHRLAA